MLVGTNKSYVQASSCMRPTRTWLAFFLSNWINSGVVWNYVGLCFCLHFSLLWRFSFCTIEQIVREVSKYVCGLWNRQTGVFKFRILFLICYRVCILGECASLFCVIFVYRLFMYFRYEILDKTQYCEVKLDIIRNGVTIEKNICDLI